MSSRSLLETLTPVSGIFPVPPDLPIPQRPDTRIQNPVFPSTRASRLAAAAAATAARARPASLSPPAGSPQTSPFFPFSLPSFFFFFSFSHFLLFHFLFLSPSPSLSLLLPRALGFPPPSLLCRSRAPPARPSLPPHRARPPLDCATAALDRRHPSRTRPRCRAAPRPRACQTRAAPAPPRRRAHACAHGAPGLATSPRSRPPCFARPCTRLPSPCARPHHAHTAAPRPVRPRTPRRRARSPCPPARNGRQPLTPHGAGDHGTATPARGRRLPKRPIPPRRARHHLCSYDAGDSCTAPPLMPPLPCFHPAA